MLLSFFLAQLRTPSKGDWTQTVMQDLKDFQMNFSIDFFKNTSKEKIKKLVKQKATEFSFGKLMENKKRYSKLKDLTYSAFQLQSYLKDGKTSVEEKINAFKFRTKMALFGQNFRGNRECVMCPLCKIHVDSQDLVSECPILKTKITMKNKMKEIYDQEVGSNAVKMAMQCSMLRQELC